MQVQVNWIKLVQLQVPQWMRRKRLVVWLLVLISGVRSLHANFLDYRKNSIYSLLITGQTIYLEKALNDQWDFLDRGIYIETATDPNQFYLYNRIEAADPVYFYNRYNGVREYAIGDYAVEGTRIWKAVELGFLDAPEASNAQWSDEGERLYLRNKIEGNAVYDFIIWVPVGVVFGEAQMRALVDLYKLAGKTYTIQTY